MHGFESDAVLKATDLLISWGAISYQHQQVLVSQVME